jgi:superfamily II DNA or RNA helicase
VSIPADDDEARHPAAAHSGPLHSGAPVRRDLLFWMRSWQKDAFAEYFRVARRDFLLVATPGAGKTALALTVAAELLARREIAAVTVVTPTEHLKHQWAQAAHRYGIAMDSGYRNAQGRVSADFTAVAVTYAQVAAHPALHRRRTENRRTLVIFDEIHHAGDALSWGEAVREAFDPARRRMGLTGTPFRSDANPIPFVTYVEDAEGARRSSSDYVYGYGPALGDGIVRPVIFLAYSGEMHWRTRAGDEIAATLGAPMTAEQGQPHGVIHAGAAPRLRRAAGARGHRGADPGAHRDAASLGGVGPVTGSSGHGASPERAYASSSRAWVASSLRTTMPVMRRLNS